MKRKLESIQWTNEANNFSNILEFATLKVKAASPLLWPDKDVRMCLEVHTDNGVLLAPLNTYILKDAEGNLSTCEPAIFEHSYCDTFDSLYPCDANKCDMAIKKGYCLCFEKQEMTEEDCIEIEDESVKKWQRE